MKPIPKDLNKAFESKVRLGIMSVLMANESVDFVTMKSLLELTDGNLTSHMRSLEAGADYIPKPADEFSINGGKIEITGTDNSLNPPVSYKIVLEYSDDKVWNKPGNFTGSNGFSADYNIDKTQAYYTKGADPSKKYYVYWDYPL